MRMRKSVIGVVMRMRRRARHFPSIDDPKMQTLVTMVLGYDYV